MNYPYKGPESLFDRSLILMVPLLTPYTTISVLILSGLLKITGKEHVYQFTSKPDIWDIPVPCPSTAGRNPENFLIIIICFCLCSAGQICLECFKGMLMKPHVKMPGDQLHLWAAPQLSHHHPLQSPPNPAAQTWRGPRFLFHDDEKVDLDK